MDSSDVFQELPKQMFNTLMSAAKDGCFTRRDVFVFYI